MADQGLAADRLRSFVERIERLMEEKKALAEDISEVFKEAKGCGFDVKIIRQVIKDRALSRDELDEREHLLALYRKALGVLVDTPLGEASVRSAVKKLGKPVPLTDAERAKGGAAAFEKDGVRMSIHVPPAA